MNCARRQKACAQMQLANFTSISRQSSNFEIKKFHPMNKSLIAFLKRYAATIGCLVAMAWPVYLLLLQAANQNPIPEEIEWLQVKVIKANQTEPNFVLEKTSGEVFNANFLSDLSAAAGRQYFIEEKNLQDVVGCHAQVGMRPVKALSGTKYQILEFKCANLNVSYDQISMSYANREKRNLRGVKIFVFMGVLLFCFFADKRRRNV